MKASHTYSSGFAQCDTQDISPFKKHSPSITNNFTSRPSQLSTQPHSKKPSLTERQIYSHQLITSIMNKRLINTVKHNIGQFNNNVQLYAKPIRQYSDNGMMEFSDQRQMYQSEYTKRVNDINRRLNHGQTLSQRVKAKKQKDLTVSSLNKSKIKFKRPASAGQSISQQSVHKKISVSGLVSYDFNSVNARNNLGFDFEHDQQKLSKIMTKLQSRNKCCSIRLQSLIQKKNKNKANKVQQIKQAIFSDFQTKTGKFLDNLHEQIQQEQTVYGWKWSKLVCIKQMMQKQKIGYQQAQAIVNQIQAKKQEIKVQKLQKKLLQNDQLQLQMRKQVSRRSKVMVRQLYFID